jgi:hypothetical protein
MNADPGFEAAEAPIQRMSYLAWVFHSLGPITILLLLLATLVAIGLIALLWQRGRGPALPAAILLLIPLPLVVGCLALVGSSLDSLLSFSTRARASEIAESLSHALVSALASSCCFMPVLIVGLAALFAHGFRQSPQS